MAKGRITAGGVHRCGVLVERGVGLGDAEVVVRPMDFGCVGVWEACPAFSGSSNADSMMWAGGGEAFILVDGAPPFAVDQ